MRLNAYLRIFFGGVCGFASGVAVAFADRVFFVGLIFGVVLSAYFAGVQRRREPFLLIAFTAISIVAYAIAYASGYGLTFVFGEAGGGGEAISRIAAFVAGYVGALIVLGGTVILFFTLDLRKQLFRNVALWSLAGGILGILGTMPYDSYGAGRADSRIHFPIWQAGLGFILAGLVERYSAKTRGAEAR